MARKAKNEPYHQMMKSRAVTLSAHMKTASIIKRKPMVI
jgi:hypothetical protein